jgi:hypothetical protein
MIRKGLIAISLLVAGCATDVVRTPEQAKAIALASGCASAAVALDPDETMPTEWLVERKGEQWFVWLPPGPGSRAPHGHPLKGAGINAKDGKIAYCDGRYK